MKIKKIIIIFVVCTFSSSLGCFGFMKKTSENKLNSSLPSELKKTPSSKAPSEKIIKPVDQEVCFSPLEGCDQKLALFISSAEKSIDVAVFDITLDQIAHLLLVKSKKLPVRIILDKRQAKGQHSLAKTLIKGGINVKIGRQRGLMHHKFTIIDNQAIELGSFNYTNNASKSNQENQIYLWNPKIVERFKERFDIMWNEAKSVEYNEIK